MRSYRPWVDMRPEEQAAEYERYLERESTLANEMAEPPPYVEPNLLAPWVKRTRYVPGSEPIGDPYWSH